MKVRGEEPPGCKASCLHRLLVEEHRLAFHDWELQLETASNGHETEAAEWKAANPAPTFKARLLANKRPDPAVVEQLGPLKNVEAA